MEGNPCIEFDRQVEETKLTTIGPVDNHILGCENQKWIHCKRGFIKCSVSNDMVGSDGDILWKDSSYVSDSSSSTDDEPCEENEDDNCD